MAANQIAISITAVDSASKVFDKINGRLSALTAPADKFAKSLSRLGETSGVSRLTEGVRGLGAGAADAFRSLDRMSSPLAAMTGAASIAGMVELTRRWAEFGNQVGNAAYRMNMPVERLTSLRGAARLAGASAADLDSGMKGLGDTMNAAVWGRDPHALQMFKTLGVDIGNTETGVRNTADALGDVAEKIKGMPALTQARILNETGIGEGLLPMLKDGRAGFEAFRKKAEETGASMTPKMVADAKEMNTAWQRLGLDFEGVGNRIVDSWSGTVTKVLAKSSDWIEHNKGLADSIGQIGAAVAAIAAIKPALWVLRLLGLGGAAEVAATGAALASPLLLSGDTPSDPAMNQPPTSPGFFGQGGTLEKWVRGEGDKRPVDIKMDATKRGFLNTIAAPESHGEYNIKNGGSHFQGYDKFPEGIGPNGTSSAAGKYQFTSGTWQSVSKVAGLKDFSPENQDKGAWYLAETRYRAKTGRDLEEDLKAGNRQQDIAAALGPTWPSLPGGSQSSQTQSAFNDALASNTKAAAAETPETASVNGHVKVEVNLKNAPPGTTANVTTSGKVSAPPPRIEMPMMGMN